MFDSISLEIVWINKLHYFHEGIYFPNNGCHGTKNKAIFQLALERLLRGKKLHRKLESYRFKLPLQKLC